MQPTCLAVPGAARAIHPMDGALGTTLTGSRFQPGSAVWLRWRTAMRRAHLFQAGERVGVAVSGGPDSMLLLEFMRELASEMGLALAVLHFNHRLRGAESDTDERFVRAQAGRLSLDFIGTGADVARAARERKRNLEATARDLRYGFFFSLLRQGRIDKVVTAHTANDQAETVLLRLIRGAGTRGLGGIHATLDSGSILRPFLELTRAEIEAEIARRGIPFRVDSSNQDSRFRRNRIRRDVLPLLEREFNPQVVGALAGFADRARDDEALLAELARERALPFLVRGDGCLKIPCARLKEFPPALARRVLRRMLVDARRPAGSAVEGLAAVPFSHADVEALRRLAGEAQSGKRLLLHGAVEARREFEWLIVGRVMPASPVRAAAGFACAVAPPATVDIPELGLRLRFTLGETESAESVKRGYTTFDAVWLPAQRSGVHWNVRGWRPGDRINSTGSEKPVKLKDYFQRARVPLRERRSWPVIEVGGEIAWARGLGAAAGFERGASCRVRLNIREESVAPALASRGA